MSSTTSHIRPRIRKTNAKTANSQPKSSPARDNSVDALERKMGSWMGLGGDAAASSATNEKNQTDIESVAATPMPLPTSSPIHSPSAPTIPAPQETTITTTTKKPAGILKKPKYSSSGTISSNSQAIQPEEKRLPKKKSSAPVVCEQFVVERDPFQKPMRRKNKKNQPPKDTGNHASIEGHQPAMTTQSAVSFSAPDETPSSNQTSETNNDTQPQQQISSSANTDSSASTPEEQPIILSSMEELFEAAGEEMPADRTTITPDSKLVEADLSFSVMTQEQYGEKVTEMKREIAQEQQDIYRMFMGNDNVFGDGTSSHAGSEDDDDSSEDEEEFLNFLMEQDMDADGEDYYQDDDEDDENNAQESTPRAFTLIWAALSRWWTPEAVEWMVRLQEPESSSIDGPLYGNNWAPQVDRSDIGASRCAGLMAMVKMYLPSSLRELGHPPDLQRTAESRIADWLRTFDYSAEAPKLPVSMWKAISCMLLEMVLVESRSETVDKLPPSVAAVNMTIDEYKYLTRSAVQAFQP